MEGESGDDTVRLRRAGRGSNPHPAPDPAAGTPPGLPAPGPVQRASRPAPVGSAPGDAPVLGVSAAAQGQAPGYGRWRTARFGLAALLLALAGGIAWWLAPGPQPPAPTAQTPIPEAPAPAPSTRPEAARPDTPPRTAETTRPIPLAEPAAPPVQAEAEQPPAPAAPAESPPPLLTEAEILALAPETPRMLRLRENPRVFVLLFPTLEAQGAALNRIAALIEKAGLPRDRLLDDAELAAAIARSGEAAATWYLGHDYNGTDLARFFALAERDGLRLGATELWVRDRFRAARALVPEGEEVALISTANADARMDPAMRAAILRHEIGHGHFFTRPELARHVLGVWRTRFTEAERRAFRQFLAREGYDASNETLMANETMAYLLFTPDPRFFAARHVGLSEEEVARLRGLMREGMPLP